MAKESSVRRRGLSQISIAVLLLLLLGALAACGDGGDTTQVAEPTEVMEEPTEVMEEPTEVMEEPTEVMEEPTEVMEEPGAGTAGGLVTLSDVADNPDAYMGQTVTVNGEASEILGPQVFRMNEGNLLDIGDEILVVHTEDQAPADLAEDTNIRVTGTVRTFVEADIEQDFDFGFDEELYVEYENRVAIVADTVEPIATVSNINEDPESYYGQEVSVIGDVVELESTYAFELDDPALLGGDTILVVGGEELTVTEGETVQVTGTVRQFNLTEIESETGFELEDELFTDFEGRPVIVASSVSPAPDAEMEETQ